MATDIHIRRAAEASPRKIKKSEILIGSHSALRAIVKEVLIVFQYYAGKNAKQFP